VFYPCDFTALDALSKQLSHARRRSWLPNFPKERFASERKIPGWREQKDPDNRQRPVPFTTGKATCGKRGIDFL
jgi:hypothetical protein